VANRKSYVLDRMAMLLLTLGDTHPKKSPKFLYICVAFHIFVVSE